MDTAIVDTINAQDAKLIAAWADCIDQDILPGMLLPTPWYQTAIADTIMSDDPICQHAQRWLIASLATNIPGIRFDGAPADADWDNLINHLRAEIEVRRAP